MLTTTADLVLGGFATATALAGGFAAHRLTHTSATGRHPRFAAGAGGPPGFIPGGGRVDLERPVRTRAMRRARRRAAQVRVMPPAGRRPPRRRGHGGRRAAGSVLAAVITYWAASVYLHATNDLALFLVAVVVIAFLWATRRRRP